uniref:Uncharacterized protein n=1 Tax=Rhizophora mucronata TaxID=61149 RepID=A0A2P2ND77_RHIMU
MKMQNLNITFKTKLGLRVFRC